MTAVAIRGIATRKLRAALSALAIVLGVAMVTGAFIVGDTMKKGADSLSKAAYNGTAAVVTAKTTFDTNTDSNRASPTIPASTVQQVRKVPGVAVAVGDITSLNSRLIGRNGKTINSGSGPAFGVGIDTHTPGFQQLSPFELQSGTYPTGPGQVAIDAGTAKDKHYKVGQSIGLSTEGGARQMRITGIVRFGGVKSIGGATMAIVDLPTAQAAFGSQGKVDGVLVAAQKGVDPKQLRASLAKALPQYKVETAAKQDRFTLDGLKSFVNFLQKFVLAFGIVAIFVGAFIIFNSLSMTVAQRSRELAMLRTVGASRRQVMRSVITEALAMGFAASVVGIGVGYLLAKGLNALFTSIGIDLPTTGTIFETRTVIVALLVGVIVTVVAGLGPAMRATRVSPVIALREGADIPAGRFGRRVPIIATVVTLIALALLGYGLFAGGVDATGRLVTLSVGCIVLFIGVALLSPKFARPLAGLLGRPGRRVGGVAGSLARENAMRNPGRTASTAAALMIGIALVTFVAVLGQGMRSSATREIDKQLKADYVVTSTDGWSPLSAQAVAKAGQTPGVQAASGIAQNEVKAYGKKQLVDGVDARTFSQVFQFNWKKGSDATLRNLGPGQAIVPEKYAKKHHLDVGSVLPATSQTGRKVQWRVVGISSPAKFNYLGLDGITVNQATYSTIANSTEQAYGFVKMAGGTNKANTASLKSAVASFPDAKVKTRSQFKDDQTKWINQLLSVFYILLGLAVIISLFGIVNTLALSVFERTRELGMLRAIGMSRRQVRRMIRHESIVTSLMGAVLGMVLGVFLAGLVTIALSSDGLGFSVPVGGLIAFTIVAIVAGMLAAIGPARRAGRLNVLNALQYE
jgi:putative ABC transport system permease protein